MGKMLLTIANVIMIQYMITSHYEVPYKWAWLVLTAVILAAILVLRKRPPH
jgi:hypothetical protein